MQNPWDDPDFCRLARRAVQGGFGSDDTLDAIEGMEDLHLPDEWIEYLLIQLEQWWAKQRGDADREAMEEYQNERGRSGGSPGRATAGRV